MKTSNIILTAFAALIVIVVTVALFATKSAMQTIVEQANEKTEPTERLKDSVMIEDFHTLVAEGDGRIILKQSPRNTLIVEEGVKYSLNNNVLKIDPKDASVILEFKNLRNLRGEDDIRIKAQKLSADTLNIHMDDDARLDAEKFTLKHVDLIANDDARISFEEAEMESAEIILNDDADVYLINTICKDLNFEQNDDSDLNFKGKTKIGRK